MSCRFLTLGLMGVSAAISVWQSISLTARRACHLRYRLCPTRATTAISTPQAKACTGGRAATSNVGDSGLTVGLLTESTRGLAASIGEPSAKADRRNAPF